MVRTQLDPSSGRRPEMGEVRAVIVLENEKDRILADAGHLPEQGVRRCQIDALVDTGAVMVLLPEEVVTALGLDIDGTVTALLANDTQVELPRARHLSLAVGDRQMDTDCLVGPPRSEPLLGQLVLERLDLIVDPGKRTLGVRPESPNSPTLKLK
jgi:predicted aspartyl protease